ncbi:MAG: inositol-3-phosphate synthase [Gemmataceae bacterium]|jgi:myo-inositol-1-phosphate synthase|nr:inositol-3-phosphate synthase [Gemmataceae bacterium]
MTNRKVGLWLIGAFGGVGTTVTVGLTSLCRGLAQPIGLVTAKPLFQNLDLVEPHEWVIGGHDVRAGSFYESATGLMERSGVFGYALLQAVKNDLDQFSKNVQPGIWINESSTHTGENNHIVLCQNPKNAVAQVCEHLQTFKKVHGLDRVVVVNVASTEPIYPLDERHQSPSALLNSLTEPCLPPSSIYALAAIQSGCPYVNFTPSLGASLPALELLAQQHKVPIAGKDGKTGETLLKSALAPLFAARNLRVRSWVGHNILGGGDGRTLNSPANKESKVKSKDVQLPSILGYPLQTHVSIEYVESLDDWKTAWDHIHFEGFLGTKMTMQFTWQGCDSLLAAPLVIDLARLIDFAARKGESGIVKPLACFFKSPEGVTEHDFFKQTTELENWVRSHHPLSAR